MNYDLAKKLKDAGFPRMDVIRDGEEFQLNAKSSQQGRYSDDDRDFHLDSDGVRLPTLSELIEACGEKFTKLERWNDYEYEWRAAHGREGYMSHTPEEAVANLWLALNEKK